MLTVHGHLWVGGIAQILQVVLCSLMAVELHGGHTTTLVTMWAIELTCCCLAGCWLILLVLRPADRGEATEPYWREWFIFTFSVLFGILMLHRTYNDMNSTEFGDRHLVPTTFKESVERAHFFNTCIAIVALEGWNLLLLFDTHMHRVVFIRSTAVGHLD